MINSVVLKNVESRMRNGDTPQTICEIIPAGSTGNNGRPTSSGKIHFRQETLFYTIRLSACRKIKNPYRTCFSCKDKFIFHQIFCQDNKGNSSNSNAMISGEKL